MCIWYHAPDEDEDVVDDAVVEDVTSGWEVEVEDDLDDSDDDWAIVFSPDDDELDDFDDELEACFTPRREEERTWYERPEPIEVPDWPQAEPEEPVPVDWPVEEPAEAEPFPF